ncbi:hypothetical protein [Campylobacter corcagiensis]|uniref:hypothetical protein n=1 Tax=Campylobacter corcagiensis TaxID=1448857 RepID=UPI00046FDDE0|nr:hypothetical protein [Campylobacter corcagiensis]QKF64092.1 hypothetical protein CCORG_0203 [Campylobacter corcagiensis]
MLSIPFDRVKGDVFPFEITKDSLKFSGNLSRKSLNLVKCKGQISGVLPHICDRCGDDMEILVNESVDLLLSDGACKTENLDVMEFFGSIIIDEILHSEVESLKAGYFYCKNCENL